MQAAKAFWPSPVQLVFDTNILVDALLARGDSYAYAVQLLEAVRDGKVEGWYAPHCITTVYYLIERTLARETFNRKQTVSVAQALVRKLLRILKPLPQVGDELLRLEEGPGDDWDDRLIVDLAKAYLPNPLIVTRDRWFLQSQGPWAAHPKEIIESGLTSWSGEQSRAMPFLDLAAQQRRLRPEVQAGIHRVLQHGQYIMGPEIKELERKLAEYVGVKHAVGCSSGTDALLLALMAYGVGPGDAIFTTPFTFIATAEVISLVGATPVFVDIDPVTYNLDPERLREAIRALQENDADRHPLPRGVEDTKLRPRGVIAVDLYGLPADYDALKAVCAEHDLFVMEDAAQSFGAAYKGRKACSLADVGATSFFPVKPLGGYGDGGMVFTNLDDLAEICRSLLVHGKGRDKYDNVRIGLNARLDTLQAAILLAKFEVFPEELKARQHVAARYTEGLEAHGSLVTPPRVPEGSLSAWAQYTVRVKDGESRRLLMDRLKAAGIPTVVYYPKPLHLQTAFAQLGYRLGDFPVSEAASQSVFSLPFGPYLTAEEQTHIFEALSSL